MGSRATAQIVTIANGATSSGIIKVPSGHIVGVEFPAAMTGTSLTFQTASNESETFKNVYKSGGTTQLSVSKQDNGVVQIDVNDSIGIMRFLKIVSNSSEGADRTLKLIIRNLD